MRVLDAGSGVTFFPHCLQALLPGLTVVCCDRDAYLGKLYEKTSGSASRSVEFCRCDLGQTPFRDGEFDAIYCISVLEHTPDHAAIVGEFKRILKPGGRLLVTYDVSLDGRSEIPVEEAVRLRSTLASHLVPVDAPPLDALQPGLFTCRQGQAPFKISALWRAYGRLVRVAKSLTRGSMQPSRMTVYCAEFAREEV